MTFNRLIVLLPILIFMVFLAGCVGQYQASTPAPNLTPTAPEVSPAPEEKKEITPTPTPQPTPTQPQPQTVDVEIRNYAFSPSTITIKVGDSVRWTNRDSVGHTATADDNSFDTGSIGQGQSKTITFDKAGTYNYHCTPHPWMKAKIIVK